MNRYFATDPRIMSGINFFTGRMARQQEVADQQGLIDFQQQQKVFGGLGGGLSKFLMDMGQYQREDQVAARNFGNQQELQRGQQAGQRAMQQQILDRQQAIEEQRAQGDIYQDFLRRNPNAGQGMQQINAGALPELSTAALSEYEQQAAMAQGGQPNMSPSGQGPAGEGGMSSPGGVPMPSQNPAMTAEHQRSKDRLGQLLLESENIDRNPYMPAEERRSAHAALTPHIVKAREMLQRYPQQKAPTTYEELVQAGVHNGGVTPMPGGGVLVPKGVTWADGPKAAPAEPPSTPEQAESVFRTRVSNYDAKVKEGYDFVLQNDGKIEVIKPEKQEKDSGVKRSTYQQARTQALKILGQKGANGTAAVVSPEEVEKQTKDIIWNEMTPAEQRIQSLEGGLRGLMKDFPGGPATMPPHQQDQLREFAAELRALKGG